MAGPSQLRPSAQTTSTRTTSPVLEFRCLYTFNITQKRKIWQDGTLKFHLRNQRVMVYDTACNYVGDGHWQLSALLAEGDELELHSGALVQVAALLRHTTSDISALVDKRNKRKQGHTTADGGGSSPAASTASRPDATAASRPQSSAHIQKKHRSLSAVLQTSQAFNLPLRRSDPVVAPWTVTTTVRPPSLKRPTIAHRPAAVTPSQTVLPTEVIIDLTLDPTQIPPPPHDKIITHAVPSPRTVLHQSRNKLPVLSLNDLLHPPSPPRRPTCPPLPAVNSANELSNVEAMLASPPRRQPIQGDDATSQASYATTRPPPRPLRLATTKKTTMLVCMQAPTTSSTVVAPSPPPQARRLPGNTAMPPPSPPPPPPRRSVLRRSSPVKLTRPSEAKVQSQLQLPFTPPVPPPTAPEDVGPWSSEALDLFDWRPPDWEQRRAQIPSSVSMPE